MNKVTRLGWGLVFVLGGLLAAQGVGQPPAHAGDRALQIITETAPPASFTDKDGELAGLAVEIVRAVQEELGDRTQIQVMPWARGYDAAVTTADVALFPTTRTPAREQLFQWVGPLFTTRWVIYARAGSGFRFSSLDDARSISRIGVYRDDARAQLLRDEGFENLYVVSSQESTLQMLLGGRVDAILYSDLTLKDNLDRSGIDPDLVEPVFEIGSRDIYIAFSADTAPQRVRTWREAFDRLEQRGELERIRARWLP